MHARAALNMAHIIETVRLSREPDALWQKIGAFCAVGEWHPMLAKVTSEGEKAGSLRTAEGRDGTRQTERLLDVAPVRRSYRYRIENTPMPVRGYTAELRVEDNRDGTSTIVWSADFEPTSDEHRATEGVRSFLKAGLKKLVKMYR